MWDAWLVGRVDEKVNEYSNKSVDEDSALPRRDRCVPFIMRNKEAHS